MIILRQLSRDAGLEIEALIHREEANLVACKAEESVLRERLRDLQAEEQARAQALAASPDGKLPERFYRANDSSKRASKAQTNALLDSIERSLGAIQSMRQEAAPALRGRPHRHQGDRRRPAQGIQPAPANLERNKQMFLSVMEQLKQAQLVSDYSSVTAQVLNPPSASPGRPLAALVLLVGLVLGCGLGIGCAFLSDLLDSRIRTLPEIRKALDVSVLGLIPQLSRETDEIPSEIGLISHVMPRSLVAESFKSIRTNLEFHRRSRRVQVLQVTSPHSGDGKSTSASNLAISLAHAGRKVLLVDADLRRPAQHHIFSLSRDRGLVHILKELAAGHARGSGDADREP